MRTAFGVDPIEGFVAGQVAAFRERATLLAGYGAREAAEAIERVANDLEAAFRAWHLAELTTSEAAQEAGYSEHRIRELFPGGTARKIRRCDLPRKPRGRALSPSLAQVAAGLRIA